MIARRKNRDFGNVLWPLLLSLLCITLTIQRAKANERSIAIPNGTILPVRLNSTLSSAKCKPGQRITGRIMQDVPLLAGNKIRKGSKVIGHILGANPAISGHGESVSLQFDKLISENQTFLLTTDLRAIASFMDVMDAQTPPIGPGEGDVYDWLTTVQVGGDVVYGVGGPVTSVRAPNDVVGVALQGGVLVHVKAHEADGCRGSMDGDDRMQALWVFSSDACGTYGLSYIRISHAGRSDPTGVIVLASDKSHLKIREGAGMLLRVIASGSSQSRSR